MGRTRPAARSDWPIFWNRATSYYKTLQTIRQNRDDACVGVSVHCSIAAIDAFTTFSLGERSAGQSHNEAVLLLKKAKANDENEKSGVCQKLMELISLKNVGEYEDRNPSRTEADRAIAIGERVYKFVESELKKGGVLAS